jgi:hypothetical protein
VTLERSFVLDPNFVSWLGLFVICLVLAWRQGRHSTRLDLVISKAEEAIAGTTAVNQAGEKLLEYFSGQTDISVHHSAELMRIRQSLLELAFDLDQLSALQYITTIGSFPGAEGSKVIDRFFRERADDPSRGREKTAVSNHVFERHTALPDELPEETRTTYRSSPWACPVCGTTMPDNWAPWCTVCRRPTYTFASESSPTIAAQANDVGPDTQRVSVPPANADATCPSNDAGYPWCTCEACGQRFYVEGLGGCPDCGSTRIEYDKP